MSWTLLGYAKHYSITLPHWEFEKGIRCMCLIEQELCFSLSNPTTQHHPPQQLNSFLSVKKSIPHMCVCVGDCVRGPVLVRWGRGHRSLVLVYILFPTLQRATLTPETSNCRFTRKLHTILENAYFSLGNFNTIVSQKVLWKTSFFKEDKACEISLNKYATKESFDV